MPDEAVVVGAGFVAAFGAGAGAGAAAGAGVDAAAAGAGVLAGVDAGVGAAYQSSRLHARGMRPACSRPSSKSHPCTFP